MALRAIVARFLHAERETRLAGWHQKSLGLWMRLGWTQKSSGNCQQSNDAQKSWSGHSSCDGTVDYLLRDRGSVGHRNGQRARRERRGLPAVPGTTGRTSCGTPERLQLFTVSAGPSSRQGSSCTTAGPSSRQGSSCTTAGPSSR